MTLFVVLEEQGPAWLPGREMREQPGWTEHAAFVDGLERERLVVLGGPLRGGDRHRAMLVIDAADEPTARGRLAEDPWMRSGVLRTVSFDRWELLLGTLG